MSVAAAGGDAASLEPGDRVHRGVMTTFGKPAPDVYEEGIHLRLPIAQVLHLMDVRIQKGEADGDLEDATEKAKAGAKAVANKAGDLGKDLDTEYKKEKIKEKLD